MSDDPRLRASDDERERLAGELKAHFAEGRLSTDELGERLDAVYRARTAGELQTIRADLPVAMAHRRAELWRQLIQQAGGAAGAFVVCVAIWAFSGAHGSFWPVWILLPAVLLLVRNGWRLFGPAPDLDRVEAELERRREHRRDRR